MRALIAGCGYTGLRLARRLVGEDHEVVGTTHDPGRLTRTLASRRVSNPRLREELGVSLRYPSFREGLPAALHEKGAPP